MISTTSAEWVPLASPGDGTPTEVAERCRAICLAYLNSLANPMDGACWTQSAPCHNNLCPTLCSYLPYAVWDRHVYGTAWLVTMCYGNGLPPSPPVLLPPPPPPVLSPPPPQLDLFDECVERCRDTFSFVGTGSPGSGCGWGCKLRHNEQLTPDQCLHSCDVRVENGLYYYAERQACRVSCLWYETPHAPPPVLSPPPPPPTPPPPSGITCSGDLIFQKGAQSSPNTNLGIISLSSEFCIEIRGLTITDKASNCGSWSHQDGRSGRSIVKLGVDADAFAGVVLYYNRNCKGINFGVDNGGHWVNTNSYLAQDQVADDVPYNVVAKYTANDRTLEVEGPDGLLGVSNAACYPCSSWTYPTTGDVSVFVGRVGHIYPWNTVGAHFDSLRVYQM